MKALNLPKLPHAGETRDSAKFFREFADPSGLKTRVGVGLCELSGTKTKMMN